MQRQNKKGEAKRKVSPNNELNYRSSSESASDDDYQSCTDEDSVRCCKRATKKVIFEHFRIETIEPNENKNVHTDQHEDTSIKQKHNLDSLPEDVQESICNYLNDISIEVLFFVSVPYLNILKAAHGILKKFTFFLDYNNFEKFASFVSFRGVRLRNISVDFKGFTNFTRLLKFLNYFENSVENLHIKNAKFKNFKEFSQLCNNLSSIKTLRFEYCGIDQIGKKSLPILSTLKLISFNKCNDNIYGAFENQTTITKIEVSNEDWTWNGFPHDIFNVICHNCKNLEHIVLNGAGTGSYFDADEFPYKITKLETSMITFHWYVGIRTKRVCFLESQKGHVKDLTIHQLPNDFDGGRVVNYIFEEMNLETFYYGKIPLILNGEKQNVLEFSATEIQITAAIEMIRRFPSIISYCLILSEKDIASDEIEKAINLSNKIFRQLKKFEVIDNSKYRGLFCVFLGLLKNLINIEILSLTTQDRNINVMLEESLPFMTNLKELYLSSIAPRGKERLNIIKAKAPFLQKLSVAEQFVEDAKVIFDNNIEIIGISSNIATSN
ncbi:unnamed protein product [Chironomus riparius]|uniref:Uncharacterized protein n=1 Tax=Chironomus riparius TaxID=315576 RepID=A0A9N9S787_9DIPT|nr:unnamed protein product [Chironomus riparius]